ncbi:merr bacterial regulatory protein hth signature [Lucifera butyrica]|uniref:Merr bacterial regulatory protein hth signature n=1 Tax=Lucifera butyrica TaxID=1351585 RepID=A0A498R873_9FIRM|nr:MerR family transcriptional regulator [Lucifera butyrica]VBB07389.1 merr bacterial regulatory protein hth signature [Lucifera butyrica]
MGYTIKQVAETLDLTAYTLRYYEKEGLLPFIERDKNGNRIFNDNDVEWVSLIRCLRDTGMSVSEIKRYVELCLEGDKTVEVRRLILLQHKKEVEQKIEQMNGYLVRINKKLSYYDNFVIGQVDCCNPKVKGIKQRNIAKNR